MSKYFFVLPIVLLLPQIVLSVNLEKLLNDKISDAKCFAQCQAAANEEDREQCFVICKIIQETPETDLCELSEICLGGCRIACGEQNRPNMETRFLNVVLDKCKLSWEVEGDRKKVAFLVAGEDQGNMWNLVFNKLTSNKVHLTPQMAAKFVKIQIFAINEMEVSDKISISLVKNNCFEKVPEPREISIEGKEEEAISVATIILLATIGTCSVLFIAAVIYFRTRSVTVWEPAAQVTEELSYAIADLTFSTPNSDIRDNFLTQEHFLAPQGGLALNMSDSSSSDYEEVCVGELEYIEPFIC